MRPFLINRSAAVSWPSLMMWALVISMSVSAVICAHVNAPQVYDRQSEGNMSDEQTHYGACNLCEAICGLEFRVRDGHIVSIRGDDADPLSRGHICPKAVALQDLHEDPDRLRKQIGSASCRARVCKYV